MQTVYQDGKLKTVPAGHLAVKQPTLVDDFQTTWVKWPQSCRLELEGGFDWP